MLLPFGLYFAYVQSLPAQFGGLIMGSLPHKISLAQNTPGPRLILVGGSSSPYATNCAQLAGETGYPCINLGVTAYLGLGYYLALLEDTMRPGDVVVLAPEHSMLAQKIDYKTVWMAIENHPEAWRYLPPSYWPHMAGAYGGYAQEKRASAKRGQGGPAPLAYPPGFGPLGDVTEYRELILESGYNREDPISLSPEVLAPESARLLKDFAAKASAGGVTVLYAWAPVNELALTSSPAEALLLEEEVRAQTGLPILGSVLDSILPATLFYDSNAHLNTAGAAQYTQALARLLALAQSQGLLPPAPA